MLAQGLTAKLNFLPQGIAIPEIPLVLKNKHVKRTILLALLAWNLNFSSPLQPSQTSDTTLNNRDNITDTTVNQSVNIINAQTTDAVLRESVKVDSQSRYLDLVQQAKVAFEDKDYCEYSRIKLEIAKIILDNPSATYSQALGPLFEAKSVNPFDQEIIEALIDTYNKVGWTVDSNLTQARDTAYTIKSSCEIQQAISESAEG